MSTSIRELARHIEPYPPAPTTLYATRSLYFRPLWITRTNGNAGASRFLNQYSLRQFMKVVIAA